MIVVPQKIIGASQVWRNLLSTAQIAASIAITAAVAGFQVHMAVEHEQVVLEPELEDATAIASTTLHPQTG